MDFVDKFHTDTDLSLLKKLTIVIPTYNRNYYLSRLLYYLKNNFFQNVLIADSSNASKQKINKEITNILFNDNIYHWYFGEKYVSNAYEKLYSVLERVETPYVVLCGDKDFPILTGVINSLKYLDENPDYHIADGKYYLFQPDYFTGNVKWEREYTKKRTISSNSPISRVESLIINYQPLFYSLYRTETLYNTLFETMKYVDDLRFGELFSGALPLVSGKYAYLDVDYWCRESNPAHSSSMKLPRLNDYLMDGTYNSKYRSFKDGIHANLPYLSLEEINSVIDPAMNIYLKESFPQLFTKKSRYYYAKFFSEKFFRTLPPVIESKLHTYCRKAVNTSHQNKKNSIIDLPLEVREIQTYLMQTMDNTAYINDLALI